MIGEIIPLGIGLTETPAAEVKGIAVKKEEETEEETKADEKAGYPPDCSAGYEEKDGKCVKVEPKAQETLKNDKKVSHSEEKNVNDNKDSTIMKITSINDINEETLKVIEASEVSDFIESELKKASEEFAAEKTALEDKVHATKEEQEALIKKHDEMKEQFDKVNSTLETLEAEKLEREKLDQFNQRMSLLDDTYALSDEEREVIASDIKDLDDEGFAAYQSKMEVLLKDKHKKTLAESEKAAEAIEAAEKKEEVVTEETKASDKEAAEASEEKSLEEEVVENAVDQAENAGEEIPVTTAAEEPTIQDKYKDAFSIDNFDIKL